MSTVLGQNHNQSAEMSRKRVATDAISNGEESDPESKIMHSSDDDQLMTIGAIVDPHK